LVASVVLPVVSRLQTTCGSDIGLSTFSLHSRTLKAQSLSVAIPLTLRAMPSHLKFGLDCISLLH
jgi:hypothetical protein